MSTALFIQFAVLNTINVAMQTIKSRATHLGGKWTAALVNATTYAFYQIILVYAVCDLPLGVKMATVFMCNLVGVYIVKDIEIKIRKKLKKEKLWKIEITLPKNRENEITKVLDDENIPFSPIAIRNTENVRFDIYCYTKVQSAIVHNLVRENEFKYTVVESTDF